MCHGLTALRPERIGVQVTLARPCHSQNLSARLQGQLTSHLSSQETPSSTTPSTAAGPIPPSRSRCRRPLRFPLRRRRRRHSPLLVVDRRNGGPPLPLPHSISGDLPFLISLIYLAHFKHTHTSSPSLGVLRSKTRVRRPPPSSHFPGLLVRNLHPSCTRKLSYKVWVWKGRTRGNSVQLWRTCCPLGTPVLSNRH